MYPRWFPKVAIVCTVVIESLAPAGAEPLQTPRQTSSRAGAASDTFSRLSSYLVANPIDFQTSFDVSSKILDTDLRGKMHVISRQPNLLRLETSSGPRYLVVSDGTTLTIYNVAQRKYAQFNAPASSSAAISLFTGLMSVESQVLRFFEGVKAVAEGKAQATAVGHDNVGHRQCDRFTVVGQLGENWEAWLEQADVPLPCKLVSWNSDDPTVVQTNVFSWTQNPAITQGTFTFTAPNGAEKVDAAGLNLAPPE